MPKRGAEDYLTKDGVVEDTDRKHHTGSMSTPAQIARRKLATPKSRVNRGSANPSSFTSANSSNVFGGQQQPLGGVNGVGFGQDASQNQSQAFNFAPSSTSFSFSHDQSAPNPFANMSQNDDQDQSMESPQKKPFFGNTETVNGGSSSGGFTFSTQTNQANGLFNFNTPQTNGVGNGGFNLNTSSQPTTNSLFGQQIQAPSSSVFGRSTSASQETKPAFSFGQSSSTQQPTSTSFSFGATPSQQTTSSFSGFGDVATSQPKTAAPLFNFSQPSASQTPAFGTDTIGADQTKADPPFKFAFGQPSAQPTVTDSKPKPGESDKQVQSKTSGFQFGQSSGFGTSFGSSPIFGQPTKTQETQESKNDPQPSKEATSPQKSSSSFTFGDKLESNSGFKLGQFTATSGTASSAQQNESNTSKGVIGEGTQPSLSAHSNPQGSSKSPFADLFAGSPSTNLFGGRPPTSAAPPKAAFNFSIPSNQQQSGFDSSATPVTPSAGIFSSSKYSSGATSTTGEFVGQSSQSEQAQTEKPAQEKPSANQEPAKRRSVLNEQSEQVGSATSSDVTANPTHLGLGSTPNAASQPPILSAATTLDRTSSSTSAEPANLYGSRNASLSSLSNAQGSSFGAEASKPTPPNAAQNIQTSDPKRTVFTKSPARVPNHLNAEGYKDYANNYQLHSLNREFQQRIAALDPETKDFDNIIRHYVAARDSIGDSLGLFSRTTAGMKRKNGDDEDDHDMPSQYKRPKQDLSTSGLHGNASNGPSASKGQASNLQGKDASNKKASAGVTPQFSFATETPNSFSTIPQGKAQNNHSLFGTTSTTDNTSHSPSDAVKPTSAKTFSTTPPHSPPKKTGFQMPQFAAPTSTANFFTSFAQNAASHAEEEKQKRKYEDVGSDEEDDPDWEQRYDEEQRKKRAKFEQQAVGSGWKPPGMTDVAPASAPKPAATFGVSDTSSTLSKHAQQDSKNPFGSMSTPKPSFSFGVSSAAGVSAMSPQQEPRKSFGSTFQPSNSAAESSEVDNKDDDEEADDEEETRQNENAEDDDWDAGDDEATEDSLPEDEVDEEDNTGDEGPAQSGTRRSLFDRITRPDGTPVNGGYGSPDSAVETSERAEQPSAPAITLQPGIFGNAVGKSTPEQPSFSPLTPASGLPIPEKPYKASPFKFTPTPTATSSEPVAGASIFAGGAVKSGDLKGEGLFGSRPSTPVGSDLQDRPAGPADQTWNPEHGIKFSSTPQREIDAPAINISAATPSGIETIKKNPFAGLFGQNTSSASTSDSTANLGFSFGAPSTHIAPGFLGAASHLLPGGAASATSSAVSSRATSPGGTDNESVGTDNTEDMANEPQTSLTQSREGEENCDVLFQGKAKALKLYTKDMITKQMTYEPNSWQTVGLGDIRVLKDRTTKKTRVVLKTDPGAKVVLNDWLLPHVKYEYVPQPSSKNGAIRYSRYEDDKYRQYILKLNDSDAIKVAELLEREKSSE